MRCIVEYDQSRYPPLLRLYVHGAPHRRQHYRVIQKYRDELVAAGRAAGVRLPIMDPIDLAVTFINPCSPDLDNLITALYRAVDGTSHDKPTLLEDDSLIHGVTMGKFYPNESTKADRPNRRERAPKRGRMPELKSVARVERLTKAIDTDSA